jgi:hypothetical protein
VVVTPEEYERIKVVLAKIRLISEDFHNVFLNRLMAVAPELRVRYVTSMLDDTTEIFVGFEEMAAAADDPAELQNIILALPKLNQDDSHHFQRLGYQAFIWTAARCLGAQFGPEERAAFTALNRAFVAAFDRVHGRRGSDGGRAASPIAVMPAVATASSSSE